MSSSGGSEQVRPSPPSRHKRRTLAVAVGLLVVLGSGLAAGIHALGLDRLPDVRAVTHPLPADTLVYDHTGGTLIADLHPGGYQHYQTRLQDMGHWLPAAAEADSGSTIAQRLVRLRLGVGGPSIAGRLRQAVLASQLSLNYSSSQILEAYLQSLFYGNGAFGPQAAAQVYFGVDASKLDLAQAALLAGLPDQPTRLNPFRNLAAAKQRQRRTLDAMVRNRTISAGQADQAYAESLQLTGPKPTVLAAPGFVQYVVDELKARFSKDPYGAGLRVVTTLDLGLQQQAELALRDAADASSWRGVTSGALVAIDPRSGALLAMVGSLNPTAAGGAYNMAVAPRNPGTAFRVFTYTAAIASKRYTMVTPLPDAPITVDVPSGSVPRPYRVFNFDRRFRGTCELQACLGNSLNPPAIQAELGTSIPDVVKTARAMGAPPLQAHFDPRGTVSYTTDAPADSFGPSLTLGGYGETPLQLASAISVLASGGLLRKPTAISSVTRSAGSVVLRAGAAAGVQAVDAGTAFIVSQMLADDVNRAMIFGRGSPMVLSGRHAAALTGTTDNFGDAWTVGYTPSLAAAVWMGNSDNSPMISGSDGVFVAAPAWHQFMQAALDAMQKSDEWYAPPAGVESSEANGRQAYFLTGTSAGTPPPPLPDQVHLEAAGAGQ